MFTVEAMRAARAHLTPQGAFGMYNYYREPWLIDRLAGSIQTVYGNPPCVDNDHTYGRFALLMIGRSGGHVRCANTWSLGTRGAPSGC